MACGIFLQQSWISISDKTSSGGTCAVLSGRRLTGTRTLNSSSTPPVLGSWTVSGSGSRASISRSIWVPTVGSANVQDLIVGAENARVGGYVRHWHGFHLPIKWISATTKVIIDQSLLVTFLNRALKSHNDLICRLAMRHEQGATNKSVLALHSGFISLKITKKWDIHRLHP